MGETMHDSQLFKRIRSEMDRIRILDTHEHLYFPHQLAEMKKIDFGLLFTHYTNSDLISAGMPPDQMAEVGNMSSKLSPAEKWRLLKPWYAKAWNTAYCESIRIAMRDLFGIEDLSDKTVEPLSVKMNSVNRRTWTREVFDRAIRAGAASIIVVHNHPSGDPTPSDDDIRLTRRLTEAGKILGIRLLDHVVVSRDSHYSFRSHALV